MYVTLLNIQRSWRIIYILMIFELPIDYVFPVIPVSAIFSPLNFKVFIYG